MIPIYNSDSLLLEQEKITSYLSRKAFHKKYPSQFLEDMAPLIEKMYFSNYFEPRLDLLNDPLVISAYEFAQKSHFDQERKYSHQEYIVHPLEMASRLTIVPNITKNEIISAFLHDVVEDCNISPEEIQNTFGDIVSEHLDYLTDHATAEDGNRAIRTEINFQHFILSPIATKNIKLTDLISNTRSIAICDPNFCLSYMPALKKMASYFNKNKNVVDPILINTLNEIIVIADQIAVIQKKYNIIKLDKKKSDLSKSLPKKTVL